MKIKPLRGMVGEYGQLHRNRVANVPDHIAQQLVKRGVAIPVQSAASNKGGAAKKASANPPKASRTGGQTGETKRSPSSPAGPASGT